MTTEYPAWKLALVGEAGVELHAEILAAEAAAAAFLPEQQAASAELRDVSTIMGEGERAQRVAKPGYEPAFTAAHVRHRTARDGAAAEFRRGRNATRKLDALFHEQATREAIAAFALEQHAAALAAWDALKAAARNRDAANMAIDAPRGLPDGTVGSSPRMLITDRVGALVYPIDVYLSDETIFSVTGVERTVEGIVPSHVVAPDYTRGDETKPAQRDSATY